MKPVETNAELVYVGEPNARRLQLIPFDKISLGRAPLYLVQGLIPRTGLSVIWGAPKSGKSFWAFDLAMHVALGMEYRGRRVQQGPVVYCAFEGQSGIRARCEAFRQRFLPEQADEVPFYLEPLQLDLVREVKELIHSISEALPAHNPVAIVLDTLNRSLRGSENSDEDMSAYVRAADALREAFDCAVLVVHHSGVEASRPRGHTSLTGAADAQLSVKRDPAGNILVTVEAMKDGAEGETIASRLEVVEVGQDDEGELITSCVIVEGEAEPQQKAQRRLPASAQVAFRALQEALDKGGEIPTPSNYIPDNTKTVSKGYWRKCAYGRGISDGSADAARIAFGRAFDELVKKRELVGVWEDECWII